VLTRTPPVIYSACGGVSEVLACSFHSLRLAFDSWKIGKVQIWKMVVYKLASCAAILFIYIRSIEIINNTRRGIVILTQSKKGNTAMGGGGGGGGLKC
jgi:hypothetical protein